MRASADMIKSVALVRFVLCTSFRFEEGLEGSPGVVVPLLENKLQ